MNFLSSTCLKILINKLPELNSIYMGHSILDWQSMSQIWTRSFFFGSLSTISRHVFFFLGPKKFFYKYTVYLENNCSHEKFFKLRKLGVWLFFTEIVAKKLFKYFLNIF